MHRYLFVLILLRLWPLWIATVGFPFLEAMPLFQSDICVCYISHQCSSSIAFNSPLWHDFFFFIRSLLPLTSLSPSNVHLPASHDASKCPIVMWGITLNFLPTLFHDFRNQLNSWAIFPSKHQQITTPHHQKCVFVVGFGAAFKVGVRSWLVNGWRVEQGWRVSLSTRVFALHEWTLERPPMQARTCAVGWRW